MSVTRKELMRRMDEGSEAEQQHAREQLGLYQKMRSRSGKRKCHFCDGKCVNPSF